MPDQSHSRPPLDPQCQAVLDAAAAAGGFAFEKPDHRAIRAGYGATTAAFAPPTPDLARVQDMSVPANGDDPAIPIRIYHPVGVESLAPVVMFFHGGGWVLGDIESHDAICRILAVRSDAIVVSVDYRLAPEHLFPAAPDDCERATRFIAANAADFGIDPNRMALAGDSAGGNLAAVTARRLRDSGDGAGLVLQVLTYPATDFTAEGGSLVENGSGYMLTKATMDQFRSLYLADEAAWRDPDASPLLADDLAGLPAALVQVAGYDPLRDEGLAYAMKLREAGVATKVVAYPSMIHGFLRMGRLVNMAQVGLDDMAAALRAAFRKPDQAAHDDGPSVVVGEGT
ncbi:MAG: alpha/beta hydrolase [Minwuia sp.]|nr:alpha/beta hydrolase [Minwuia sp.]